jgi:eukaryotic-like serine/threonine-protein kinase
VIGRTLTHYRILERLGAGGMGEVFLAYDERLDRQVAIKRIHSGKSASAERRERFRREARVAAKLNHPAIVQVYDVLAEGDVDSIVMEHVEGANLRRLLDGGPLSVAETTVIARDIAEGLVEAHRLGIVHRDLKSENVMVTPAGHAKIMDFGIAKRLLREKTEESLTAMGHVMGTYRVMSPEQARGGEVDHRSDLFSFGVLLYEALTGRSPFEAENELATLHRIVHFQQKPLRELNSEVPDELSDLVDHLLEKDPLLRPRSAGEVAERLAAAEPRKGSHGETTLAEPVLRRTTAPPISRQTSSETRPVEDWGHTAARFHRWPLLGIVLLLAAGGVASYFFFRPRGEPLYVAVASTEIAAAGNSDEAQLLASGVRTAIVHGLLSLESISPKETEEGREVSGSPQEIAKADAADEVVTSKLSCRAETCRISLNRVRGGDGALLWSESFDVPTDDFYLVATAVENQLRRGYADYSARKGDPDLAVNGADLKEFLRLRQNYDKRKSLPVETILAKLAEIRGRSPRFIDTYLFEANILRRRFYETRDTGELDRALALVQQARNLAPENPQPLFVLVDVAIAGQKLELAEGAIDSLQKLIPGDVQLLDRRANLLSARGQAEEAIALLGTAAARHPSVKRLYALAQMEYKQGRIAAAREHLQQLLARSPNDFNGLSLLAVIELWNGNVDRAARIFSSLLQRNFRPSEASNLAMAYFLLHRNADAARILQRVLAEDPNNPFYMLNLADAYLLTGHDAEARSLYRQVAELIEKDPQAATPQSLTVKGQALAHLGQGRQAVASVQEALRLAPDDGPVSFEAALVYALLGEDDSSLVNMERALKLGAEPRWFSFPWFDKLRSHPEFQSLLAKSVRPAP